MDVKKVQIGSLSLSVKDEVARQGGGGGEVTKEQYQALAIAVSILQGGAVAGLTGNVCVETFDTTDDIYITKGCYDNINHRLYA